MSKNNFLKLVTALALPQLVGLIGSWFTMPAIPEWYLYLAKPELTPPNGVFGPVWTILYVLMGIALYLVWTSGKRARDVRFAKVVFGLQLALNLFWSVAFFGLRDPFLGVLVIVALFVSIVATVLVFYKLSKTAAVLLLPYLAWVTFAGYLTYSIWMLN